MSLPSLEFLGSSPELPNTAALVSLPAFYAEASIPWPKNPTRNPDFAEKGLRCSQQADVSWGQRQELCHSSSFLISEPGFDSGTNCGSSRLAYWTSATTNQRRSFSSGGNQANPMAGSHSEALKGTSNSLASDQLCTVTNPQTWGSHPPSLPTSAPGLSRLNSGGFPSGGATVPPQCTCRLPRMTSAPVQEVEPPSSSTTLSNFKPCRRQQGSSDYSSPALSRMGSVPNNGRVVTPVAHCTQREEQQQFAEAVTEFRLQQLRARLLAAPGGPVEDASSDEPSHSPGSMEGVKAKVLSPLPHEHRPPKNLRRYPPPAPGGLPYGASPSDLIGLRSYSDRHGDIHTFPKEEFPAPVRSVAPLERYHSLQPAASLPPKPVFQRPSSFASHSPKPNIEPCQDNAGNNVFVWAARTRISAKSELSRRSSV